MKILEAINLIDRELTRVGIIPARKDATDWWARWVCDNFVVYLNFYRGAFWTEDMGETPYSGWGVTIERGDARNDSTGATIAFYSDINDLNLKEWLGR